MCASQPKPIHSQYTFPAINVEYEAQITSNFRDFKQEKYLAGKSNFKLSACFSSSLQTESSAYN
jgi:hypothetical protein